MIEVLAVELDARMARHAAAMHLTKPTPERADAVFEAIEHLHDLTYTSEPSRPAFRETLRTALTRSKKA